ncbi:MAG: carbamate kinase [Betaproteobacteria bacterium]|nr:MAG: carbamate kinase [Betaproteobacteria bacterium]
MAAAGFAVVAIGGNALIRDRAHESFADQYDAVCALAAQIAALIEAGWRVALTHGSGPQVGFALRRSELALREVAPEPMDYATADVQGAMGYMFARALHNEFRARRLAREAVAIVTQIVVDRLDPAFARPSKPVGSHMDEPRALQLAARYGWVVREDAGRGWRRVVPSPRPKSIVEGEAIRRLAEQGTVVIACGGGGIPVVADDAGRLCGVEAVVDKDFAASLLARELGADTLLMVTGVEKVALDYLGPRRRWLDCLTLDEAKRHLAQGQFAEGSMGPKVAALIEFLEGGGRGGVVTDRPNLMRAMRGETGTRLVRE